MRERIKICIVAVVLLFALIGAVIIMYSEDKAPVYIENTCETDSDCVLIQTTCCPCSTGGVEACLSNKLVTFYDKKREA